MSALDDPQDWDVFPPVVTEVQAISGNLSKAGRVPDIINGVVPLNDDMLGFLCDHEIWQLTGDPMLGGKLDKVNDQTGGMFGRAWCKDKNETVYFLGNRGGLYRWVPGARPESLSKDSIERRLQDIDQTRFRVRLAWNWRDEGVHVVLIPKGGTGEPVEHCFWDSKLGGWWPDEFSLPERQPTAIESLDGDDPDDRVLVVGHSDGYVRRWDEEARDDDGVAIVASVLLGPIAAPGGDAEFGFRALQATLADSLQGCRYEMFATDTPEFLEPADLEGDLAPGLNAPTPGRVRGRYLWIRLSSAERATRWALERLTVRATALGRPRVRT
jgi:hypothetical protein